MRKVFTFFTFAIALLFTKATFAQTTTIFVKIIDQSGTQIRGESTDKAHPNEIVAASYGQDNTGCVSSGIGGCGGTLGNFIFNMSGDKSLPLLNKVLFSGSVLKSVDIVFRKTIAGSAPFEYYKIHLENVLIAHITNSLDNAPLLAQLSLAAARAGWTYIAQRPDGSADTPVKWGWDATKKIEWLSF